LDCRYVVREFAENQSSKHINQPNSYESTHTNYTLIYPGTLHHRYVREKCISCKTRKRIFTRYYIQGNQSFGERAAAIGGPDHQKVIDERVIEINAICEFLSSQKFAHMCKLGILVINSEGIPALLFQTNHMTPKAVVTIDSWESMESIVKSPNFDINKMKTPYYSIISDRKYIRKLDEASNQLFDSLKYSDRIQLSLKGLNHFFYMGNLGYLPNIPHEQGTAWNFTLTSIVKFFDVYVKGSKGALVFIQRTPVDNNLPSDLINSNVVRKGTND